MMESIEDESEICCFGLFTSKPQTLDEMEWLTHDNDNYIKFKLQGISSSLVETLNGVFYSSSYTLGKDCLLVKKVSQNSNCSIVLIYKNDYGKLLLIEGTMIYKNNKFNVKKFIVGMKLEKLEEENSHDFVSICDLDIRK